MDKEFLLKLVDAVENPYIENMVRRTLFKQYQANLPPKSEVDEMIAKAKLHPLAGGVVHEQFEPLRARIRANETLEQVLQEFLRVVPPQKDMN